MQGMETEPPDVSASEGEFQPRRQRDDVDKEELDQAIARGPASSESSEQLRETAQIR